jgi:hypothetical protein
MFLGGVDPVHVIAQRYVDDHQADDQRYGEEDPRGLRRQSAH